MASNYQSQINNLYTNEHPQGYFPKARYNSINSEPLIGQAGKLNQHPILFEELAHGPQNAKMNENIF